MRNEFIGNQMKSKFSQAIQKQTANGNLVLVLLSPFDEFINVMIQFSRANLMQKGICSY